MVQIIPLAPAGAWQMPFIGLARKTPKLNFDFIPEKEGHGSPRATAALTRLLWGTLKESSQVGCHLEASEKFLTIFDYFFKFFILYKCYERGFGITVALTSLVISTTPVF